MRHQDEKGKLTVEEKRGIEKGIGKSKMELAIEMIRNNEPIAQIIRYTKLSEDDIRKLNDEIHIK